MSALVTFKGACVGIFADGAGESAAGESGGGGSSTPRGTRTLAAPVNSIIMGNVIAVTIFHNRASFAPQGTRTVAALIDSIIVGDAIVVAISHDVFVNVGGGGTVPDLTTERVPLNIAPSHLDPFTALIWYITIIVLPTVPPPLPSVAASHPS